MRRRVRRCWLRWGPALFVGTMCAAFPVSMWWVVDRSQHSPTEQHDNGTSAAHQNPQSATKDGPGPTSEIIAPQKTTNRDHQKETVIDGAITWFRGFFEIKLTDALIAIFTIVLAVKTAGLFRETAGLRAAADNQSRDFLRSVKAAENSARIAERALIELEQPLISFSVKHTGLRIDGKGEIVPIGPLVSFFENIGRTPAVLIEHCDQVLVVSRKDELPQAIDPAAPTIGQMHHTIFPVGVIVGPRLNYTVKENMARKPLADHLWYGFSEHSNARDHLFIHGFMRYGDIFGGTYLMGYCAIFDLIGNRFVRMGGAQHNYIHKEDVEAGPPKPV